MAQRALGPRPSEFLEKVTFFFDLNPVAEGSPRMPILDNGGRVPQNAHFVQLLYVRPSVRPFVRASVRTYLRTYVPTYLRTYVPTYVRTYLRP